jgi:hypothetical protein
MAVLALRVKSGMNSKERNKIKQLAMNQEVTERKIA